MSKCFLSGFLLFATSTAFAASCCGGGFAFPALMLGDDKAQLTTSLSHGQITDDVLANGKWLRRTDQNQSETLKIDGATLISDSLQAGFSISLISRKVAAENSTGLGDLSTGLGYEFLPEMSYSKWKPKGWGFLQITLPTAPSIYEASNNFATDSRGRGLFTAGSGLIFTKTFSAWDTHASFEVHKSFARQFTSASTNGTIEAIPGWGHSGTWGFGWSKGALRVGNSLSLLNEDPIEIRGAQSSNGSSQKNMTWSFIANYMLSMESTLTASYSDQTLFGSPENSSLSKTVTLSYQQRWQR